ncbi:putative amidohydrolase YtcJ [Bradyrhizobium sp. AZCC 2262]|uniref:amidohydrolase n=1 Tax=Bradyrhizobium sp. AZCC 2262 TaxID=3117022 RepID=UPI002FEF2B8E
MKLSRLAPVAAVCAFTALGPGLAFAQVKADIVYRNGKIYTLDGNSSVASDVAIWNGRFIAVGNNATVKPYLASSTQVVDLHGQTVIPGLNDNHAHSLAGGAEARQVQLRDTKTVAEALAQIKAAAATKKPGEWILGTSWHPASQLEEHRYLTRTEIDSVAPNNPVHLRTVGHIAMFNSAALKIAGVDRNTPDPEGGVIEKDKAGEPDGIMFERAMNLITRHIAPPSLEDLVDQYADAMKYANSLGLTSLTDPGLGPTNIRALQRLMTMGRMTVRYSVMNGLSNNVTPEQYDQATEGIGVSSGFGNDWLKLDAIGEMSIDGGMTLRTAFTRDPYPGDPNYHGIPSTPAERLNWVVSTGNKNEWKFAIHCVGDAACDRVLDAYESANKEKSIVGRRFAIIHGSMLRHDQIERAKSMGVIIELQNIFMWDKASTVERFLGADTANRVIPDRMAIDLLGIDKVSLGTDYPVNLLNPFLGLYIAVTRKDPTGHVYGADQAISREEALRLYTTSTAYATFDEKKKGSVEVGRLADMVVLDRDYMTVPVEQIKDIKPVETIVGGKVVYHR